MNWRRGLIRTWVALSVVWVLAAGAFAINDWVEYSDSARAVWAICREPRADSWCSNRWQFAPPNPFAKFGGVETPSLLIEVGLMIAPPLVVLASGFIVGWVLT